MSPPDGSPPPANLPLPEWMAEVNRRGATGILAVGAESCTRELLFVKGELRAARSTLEAEKLGSWLVARRLITEEVKQLSLLGLAGSGARTLGDLLVGQDHIERGRLEAELEELTLTIIARAAADSSGGATFLDGATARQPDTLPNVATAQLVLHAARAFPDENARRAALGAPTGLVRLTRSLDDLVHEFEFELPEAILLGRLHRGQRLADLVELSNLPQEVFEAALYALLAAGIVEVVATDGERRRTAVARPASARAPKAASPPASQPATSPPSGPKHAGAPTGATAPAPPPAKAEAQRSAAAPTVSAAEAEALRGEVRRLADAVTHANHYQVLGLSSEASYQEVFDTWDRFSQRYHPDRANDSRLSDLRYQLTIVYDRGAEAFEVLSSPQRRPRYDRILRSRSRERGRPRDDRPVVTPPTIHRSPEEVAQEARSDLIAANLRRADELVRAGDVYSAIRLLEQVCNLEPAPETLLKLARLMLINPHWANRALEKLRRALEIDPDFVEGWLELAEFWRRRQHAERERKALERVLQAAPDNEKAINRYRELAGPDELQQLLATFGQREG